MPLIVWDESFETEIAALDFEHETMIGLLNELADSLTTDSSNDHVADFLGEVYANITAHFALEERIMREAHYQGYDSHKCEHEQLLDELRDIMEQHEAEDSFDYRIELSKRLRNWFIVHFQGEDAKLHGLLD